MHSKSKIVCLPESRLKSGLGHLVRQSVLTNMLLSYGFDARLVIADEILENSSYGSWAKNLTSRKSVLRCAEARELIANPEIQTRLIIDSYDYTDTRATIGRGTVRDNLIVIDDLAYQRRYPPHVVTIIPNICSLRQKKAIAKAQHCDGAMRLHGSEYILSNPQFVPERRPRLALLKDRQRRLNASGRHRSRNILIGFGGAPSAQLDDDTRGHVEQMLQSIGKTCASLEVRCLGAAAAEICSNISIPAHNLGLLDIRQLKQTYIDADVYIGSVGYAMWERASLLLPSFVVPIARNQVPYVEVGEDLGIHQELTSASTEAWLESSREMLTSAFEIQPDNLGYLSFFQ